MRMIPAFAAMVGAVFFAPRAGAPTIRFATSRDACALLTQAEVSAALGVQVGAGTHIVESDSEQCKWMEPGKDETTAKFVMLAFETTLRFKYETSPMPGRITEALPGVGDAAVYVGTAGFPLALSVKKSDAAFQIRVLGFPDDEVATKTKEKELARKAVSRL